MVEAMLSSGELFTDLDMLRDEVEKVSGLKRLLELACTGKRNLRVGFGLHLLAENGSVVIIHRNMT